MSAITFYAGRKYANLRGSERAYARHMVLVQAVEMMVNLATSRPEYAAATRARIFNLDDYVEKAWNAVEADRTQTRAFRGWLALGLREGEATVLVGGERLGFMELALNTALVAGSPAMRLLAYLHGSCEVHAYFEPPHDNLINAITTGRRHSVLRADMGWEAVLDLAKATKATIVTDYSVSDSYTGTLKALREASWPVNFAPHLLAAEPQGYLTGMSMFDFAAEVDAEARP